MRNWMLVARSHFHGQEEEEGCQEGRQEEEGPRLSRPCLTAFGPAEARDSCCGVPFVEPSADRPAGRPLRFGLCQSGGSRASRHDRAGASTLRRERPARALGRPGRPRFGSFRIFLRVKTKHLFKDMLGGL